MTCEEFTRLEADYLAGRASAHEALALEAHASECARCGARLEAATRRDVASFAPPLPPELRASTLAAVQRRKETRRSSSRWRLGGIAAAAAVTAMVLINAPNAREASPTPMIAVTSDTDLATTPSTLATMKSRSEFEALDDAAREIESALANAPQDPELRDFLAAINARRAELEQRVKDAS